MSAESVKLKDQEYQEELMNSTGAQAFFSPYRTAVKNTYTNKHSTEFLNFAHLTGFSEMSLYTIRYARECFAFQLDRW